MIVHQLGEGSSNSSCSARDRRGYASFSAFKAQVGGNARLFVRPKGSPPLGQCALTPQSKETGNKSPFDRSFMQSSGSG
jgi:hypothetical protein